MKTLGELLRLSEEYLQKKGCRTARRTAEICISDAFELGRLDLYLQHDKPLTEDECTFLRERIQRAGKGEPPAYIHGSVQFLDCTIQVSPAVLIPRVETELMVQKVLDDIAPWDLRGKVLWDIACGSGCIGVAINRRAPDLEVILSDISPEALEVAGKNAGSLECRLGDFFQPFVGEKADIIVCNPPYISEEEWKDLEVSVRDFEPKSALVADELGLAFYERMAEELPSKLRPGGRLYMEIGYRQGETALQFFPGAVLHRDLAGHPRYFCVEFQ